MKRRLWIQSSLAAGASTLVGLPARAQSIESARVLCGFPAGGTTDAVSRRVAEKLRGGYAKVALVDNKPGAGGRLAVEELKRSAPDGATLLLTPASMITLYPHIYTKLAYKPDDFTPVSTACTSAFAFGVGPAVPESVKTLKQFLAWAKANPDKASYGSPGAGTPPHFMAALLAKESGVDLRHIPYRGSAPGIQDMLGGQLPAMSSPIGDYVQHVKTGKLRVLATSAPTRSRFIPDAPTYTEEGFPSIAIVEWYGFFLPGGASKELIDRAAAAIKAAVAAPEVVESFAQFGLEATANTPGELAHAVKAENVSWAPVVKRVGFTPEA